MQKISFNTYKITPPYPETVTVTVNAVKTPCAAIFSDLRSGKPWTVVKEPTSGDATEIRTFEAGPAEDYFTITFTFPPGETNTSPDSEAAYLVTVAGSRGGVDGPNPVPSPRPPRDVTLPYHFLP